MKKVKLKICGNEPGDGLSEKELAAGIAVASNFATTAQKLDVDVEKARLRLDMGENSHACFTFELTDEDVVDDKPLPKDAVSVGRNDPCPCGRPGVKYKKCCG